MIKVFLVEDEVIMRNGIKNYIHWKEEGMEFVGEASDGELAYPLIKKTQPDILLTDIRMPFMDGLELSRIVKKELPKIKIIILSGHGEFEYAKQAIQIGITNYLLKPISPEKLLESLKEVAEVIRKEQKEDEVIWQYQKDMEEGKRAEEYSLYTGMLSGNLTFTEILEKAQKLDIQFNALHYRVLIAHVVTDAFPGTSSKGLQDIQEVVDKYLENSTRIRSVTWGIEGRVMILEGENKEEIEELQKQCIDALRAMTKKYDGIHYFAAYGNIMDRIRDIPKSYQEASKAFSARFFLESDQIIGLKEMERLQRVGEEGIDFQEIVNSKTSLDSLVYYLKNGTMEEIDDFINGYFENIGEKNYNSLLYRQYVMMDVLMKISEFLKGVGISFASLSADSRNFEGAVAKGSILELRGYLKNVLSEALELRNSHANTRYGALMEEAQKYIKDHFQEKEISLNSVATAVGMSPNYFSTLFGQETGTTFSEFLTEKRIEKAKELLMCTNLRASEVGFQVGYKDSHYFSYIFKKMTSCTPKEYRTRDKKV